MKDVLLRNAIEGKEFKHIASLLKNYILLPLKSGIFGFAIFITILLVVKLFSYLFGTYSYFAIEISDIELSGIGFVLLFLIRLLENFKEK
jgi:hypothetical protein